MRQSILNGKAAKLLALSFFLATGSMARAREVQLGQATRGFTYYNRPGADSDQHASAVIACAREAGNVRSLATISASDTLMSPAGARWSWTRSVDENLAAASLENCMVVRGWRVVSLPEAEGRALAALPASELSNALTPWIGADQPHGEIVRVWNNDAAHGATDRYSTSPPRTKNGQLSLLAAAPELRKLPPPPQQAPPSPWVNPRWTTKPLTPAGLATIRPGAAVLLIRRKGLGFHAGAGLILNREGADKDAYPSTSDHSPDRLIVSKSLLFAHEEGDMFAFALPAGRWRLYGLGLYPTLNLCLGSPSFELKAGHNVFAGSFDLSGDDLSPDPDPAPARLWLKDPQQSVEPAVYINGSQGPCGDNTLYALEFKGAAFEPGYAWGSLAGGHP